MNDYHFEVDVRTICNAPKGATRIVSRRPQQRVMDFHFACRAMLHTLKWVIVLRS